MKFQNIGIKSLAIALALTLSGCDKAPETTLIDIKNKPVDIIKHEGWTLLTYWAEWCPSCRDEVAELNQLSAEQTLQVIGVYYQPRAEAQIERYADQLGIQYPVLSEVPSTMLPLPEVSGLPTHFLISPDNHIVGPIRGHQDAQKVKQLIAQNTPGSQTS